MLPSFMTQEFARKRFPQISDHGALVRDYTAVPEAVVFTGSIQPGTGTEDPINRNGFEVVKTIWADPEADLQHEDLIGLMDGNYFVNGAPEPWETGVLDHIVVRLSRWVG